MAKIVNIELKLYASKNVSEESIHSDIDEIIENSPKFVLSSFKNVEFSKLTEIEDNRFSEMKQVDRQKVLNRFDSPKKILKCECQQMRHFAEIDGDDLTLICGHCGEVLLWGKVTVITEQEESEE